MVFFGLSLTAFVGTFIGVVTGTAGGLMVLAIMAFFFPPAILVPLHTLVQLGASSSIAVILRRFILRATVLPFLTGAVIGATLGAQIFISLPTALLQGIIGAFILLLTWLPKFATMGTERNRFAVVGFSATFLGMLVSATGTLIAPFVLNASPERRNYAATMGALMCISHITKITAFTLLGVAVGAYTPLIVAMIASASLGSWVGGRALSRVPERLFRAVFRTLLTILALRLLWVAARGSGLF
ncbi:MAG: sulfite exporter TauE/SafE family protein [Proteobacteria bacterium]|nr:sulfite exporter TauE/SafE family protein [Pseudomonadota bacterium]MDA1325286.1 sulfite exporter TauE/SafE family protein [Pseudomonadota bacterium]